VSRAWPVPDVDAAADLATNARRILAVRIAEFWSYEPILPMDDAGEALHDMRIAAKRLRYTLELFRGVFGDAGERAISRMKLLQEELGAIHDADVRIALIEDELAALAAEQHVAVAAAIAAAPDHGAGAVVASALRPPPDDPRRGLLALLAREHAGRRRRVEALRAVWAELNAAGMRRELVVLSAGPPDDAAGPSAA